MDILVAIKIRNYFIRHNDNNRIYIHSDCGRHLYPRPNATDTINNITNNRFYWRNRNPDKNLAAWQNGPHIIYLDT
jgi:hypothetical protein